MLKGFKLNLKGFLMDLMQIYRQLYKRYGPQYWWPGDSREEIIIGAILTQNTNWKNVERAIGNLKKNKLIDFSKIAKIKKERLATLIKSSGYHHQKAKKLKLAAEFFLSLKNNSPTREQLLDIWGIGPETA